MLGTVDTRGAMVSVSRSEWEQLDATLTYLRDREVMHEAVYARLSAFMERCDAASKLTDVHVELDQARAAVSALLEAAPARPAGLARPPAVAAGWPACAGGG